MNRKKQITPAHIMLLILGVVLVLNLTRTFRAANDVTYHELRQLFEQEKVQEF